MKTLSKHKSINYFLIAVVTIFLITAAAGCALPPEEDPLPAPVPAEPPSPPPQTPQPTPEPPEPVTLRWAVWDSRTKAYYVPLIEVYKTIAPHVTIELVDLGFGEYRREFETQIIAGEIFDLVLIHDVPQYTDFIDKNLIIPLDHLIARYNIDLSAYNGITDNYIVNDRLYALPYIMDWWVLLYNKDLFDEAEVEYPGAETTFVQWAEMIKEMTRGWGANKVHGAFFVPWRESVQLFGILDGNNNLTDGSYDFLLPYYEAVLALEDGGYIMKYTDASEHDVHYSTIWAEQQTAMLTMGTWFLTGLTTGDWEFNWGVAPYPAPDVYSFGNTPGVVTQIAIPAVSSYAGEAASFIAFVCGEQGASVLASVGQTPAIMTDAALAFIMAAKGFPQDAVSRAAMSPGRVFIDLPVHPQFADIEAMLGQAHRDIMSRTQTIEDALGIEIDDGEDDLGYDGNGDESGQFHTEHSP